MDKINIANIYGCNKFGASGHIDLNLITDKQQKSIFDVKEILKEKEQNRGKIIKNYNELYKACLRKMDITNKVLKKTDMIFSLKDYKTNTVDFNPEECINYIDNKLEDLKVDTYRIDSNTLFISWFYLELLHIKFE